MADSEVAARRRAPDAAASEGETPPGLALEDARPADDVDEDGEPKSARESLPLPAPAPVLARREAPSRGATPNGSSAPPQALEMMPLDRVGEAPAISPQMTALFGGLFGMAVFASLVALLIQIFPVEDQRAVVAQAASATHSSAAAAPPSRRGDNKRKRTLLPSPWRVSDLRSSHLLVDGTMKRRAFINALNEAGVPKAEVYRILKSMEGVRKFDRTGKNDTFVVAMERGTKKVAGFEYIVDPTDIYQARIGDDGLLHGARLDMKVREEEVAVSFYVGKNLAKSYRAAGLEDGLARELNRAFNGTTSVEAFEEGGVIKVIAVEKTALGAFVSYARVRGVEYRPPDPAAKPVRAYWFEGGASPGYVDEKGRRPAARGWRTPVPGAPVTSHFNPKRMHPVLKKVMPHNGTDYGAPAGTPIYAAYRGSVVWVGMRGASGNLVLIDHDGGIQTGYAHMSRFAKGLKRGDRVGTRQLIGYVGSTGRSTGPHLHFTAKKNGKFFDALELKLDALQLLPVGDRGGFLQQKHAVDRTLDALPLPEPPEPEPAEPEPAEPADDGAEATANSEPDGDTDRGEQTDEDDDGADPEDDDFEDLMGPDLSGDLE